jgi:hypothetical protein
VELFYVDDAPRSGRPKTFIATALFIIETMTKNSVTRGWLSARIAAEVLNTPGVTAKTKLKLRDTTRYK